MLLFLRLVPNRLLYFLHIMLFNEAMDPELFKVNSIIVNIYIASFMQA